MEEEEKEQEEDQKELQLLPTPLHPIPTLTQLSPPMSESSATAQRQSIVSSPFDGPSLDLQLSISLHQLRPPSDCLPAGGPHTCDLSYVEALKWQAAEQIRLATIEKAYAERVRELTRQEMELAESEFAQARYMRERAREELEKAERMKERATHKMDSTCMEITCQACQQWFRP